MRIIGIVLLSIFSFQSLAASPKAAVSKGIYGKWQIDPQAIIRCDSGKPIPTSQSIALGKAKAPADFTIELNGLTGQDSFMDIDQMGRPVPATRPFYLVQSQGNPNFYTAYWKNTPPVLQSRLYALRVNGKNLELLSSVANVCGTGKSARLVVTTLKSLTQTSQY